MNHKALAFEGSPTGTNDTCLRRRSWNIIVVSGSYSIITIPKYIMIMYEDFMWFPHLTVEDKFDHEYNVILLLYIDYWINSKKKIDYLLRSVSGG